MPRLKQNHRGLACGARGGICRHDGRTQGRATASTHPKQENPTASAVSTHPKQGNPGKIHAHRVATGSAEPLLLGTFEPAKNKGGWVKQEALAGSRHWLGGRNGPEQNRAASAIPKARHSPQRHQ